MSHLTSTCRSLFLYFFLHIIFIVCKFTKISVISNVLLINARLQVIFVRFCPYMTCNGIKNNQVLE